jgi:CARDB
MKRRFLWTCLCTFLILAISFQTFPQEGSIQFLKIEKPVKGKNKLLFNLEHLKKIVASFNLQENEAAIEFSSEIDGTLAILGHIKKGTIKWSQKVVDGNALLVKIKNKDVVQDILAKVNAQSNAPGYLVEAGNSKKGMSRDQEYGKKTKYVETKTLLGTCSLTFVESPDLSITMKYPLKVLPGETLKDKMTISLENKGTTKAESFTVELVLSSDMKIPDQPAQFSETFKDDILLAGGRTSIPLLKPGEKITVALEGPLKVPADTVPGRYYLAAVADAGNKVKESNEVNNKDVRFIMVSLPAPKMWSIALPKAQLLYQPATFALSVVSGDALISGPREWRKCKIRPYLHQIKHSAWEGFFWEVDTDDRSIWQVMGIKFCSKGGKAREVKTKMTIKGGSKTVPPVSLSIKFPDMVMNYEPALGKFAITTCDNLVAYLPFWQCVKMESHIYRVKYEAWNYFWEVDTFKKKVSKITGVNIAQHGGTATPINAVLTVE